MTCGIYGIFDRKTQECLYVGQSSNIEARFKQHLYKLTTKRSKALKKFVDWFHENGASSEILDFRLLEECPDVDLLKNQLESKWFHILEPKFFGKIPSELETWKHSDETKKKIAEGVKASLKTKAELNTFVIESLKAKKCKNCNETFFSKKKNAIYCSLFCYYKEKSIKIPFTDDELVKLYQEGNSARAISRMCGNDSHKEISKRLKNNGIEIKEKSFSRGKTILNFTCPSCYKNFTSTDKRRIFCSRSCARKKRV